MPTPVFCCGFECGPPNGSTIGPHWNTSALGGTITTSSPITGARSALTSVTAGAGNKAVISVNTFGAGVWVFRVVTRWSVLPDGDCLLSSVNNRGIGFRVSDGVLTTCVSSAGFTFGTNGIAIATDTTYAIDVRVDTTANPHLIDAQINAQPCSQLSFAAAASTTAQQVAVGLVSGTTVTTTFLSDDVLLSVTGTDYPLGDGYVNHFVPTADGTHNVAGANDFERSATGTDITDATTTAFQLIDDVPLKSGVVAEYINLVAPPNATDYVEVVYGPAPSISTPTVAPRAVEVICAYASATAGTNNLRLAVNDNGTTDDVFNANGAVGTTAAYARKHYATAPTGGGWTVVSGAGNFNNLRMRCLTSDAAPDPWFASTMIEAEFAPVVAPEIPPYFLTPRFMKTRLRRRSTRRTHL